MFSWTLSAALITLGIGHGHAFRNCKKVLTVRRASVLSSLGTILDAILNDLFLRVTMMWSVASSLSSTTRFQATCLYDKETFRRLLPGIGLSVARNCESGGCTAPVSTTPVSTAASVTTPNGATTLLSLEERRYPAMRKVFLRYGSFSCKMSEAYAANLESSCCQLDYHSLKCV